MSGKRSRTKGHSFEREIANMFRTLGFDARRHLEYQDGEANGVDIANTGPFRIQCKRHKDYAPISAINEIQLAGIPLLITKGDRKPAMAVLPLDALMKILADVGEAYEEV